MATAERDKQTRDLKAMLMQSLASLRAGGFFSIVTSGTLSKMTAFLTSVAVVRLMSKSEYASLAYADNIYGYITLFAGLGMSSAVLKYCSGDEDSLNQAYCSFAFKWGTLFQAAIVLVAVGTFLLMGTPFPGASRLLLALVPYGFLYYWMNLYQSLLRARLENRAFARLGLTQSITSLVLSIALVPLIGAAGVAASRALSISLSILAFWGAGRSYFSGDQHRSLNREEVIPFLGLALSMLVSNLFSMMMPMNEAFIVNNLIAEEVTSANYRVANLIPSQLPFLTTMVVTYFFPSIARMRPGPEAWERIKRIGIGTFAIVLTVCVAGFLLNPLIIRTVYGTSYSDAAGLASQLWFVYLANAGFRMLPMNMLPALGFSKFNAIAAALTAVVHLALCYWTVMVFGVEGGIATRLVVNVASGCAYWIYLRHVCLDEKAE